MSCLTSSVFKGEDEVGREETAKASSLDASWEEEGEFERGEESVEEESMAFLFSLGEMVVG